MSHAKRKGIILGKEQEEIPSKFRSELPVLTWLRYCREGHRRELQLPIKFKILGEGDLRRVQRFGESLCSKCLLIWTDDTSACPTPLL